MAGVGGSGNQIMGDHLKGKFAPINAQFGYPKITVSKL
jgi:hypothetical protein